MTVLMFQTTASPCGAGSRCSEYPLQEIGPPTDSPIGMTRTLTWALGSAILLLTACAGDGGSSGDDLKPAATPSSIADPVEGRADRLAQADAYLATSAALVALLDGGPSGVTPAALRDIEPTLTYVKGPADGPGEASVYMEGEQALGIATMSASGTCFWIMNPTEGDQMFGTGMPCTGRAALQSTEPAW